MRTLQSTFPIMKTLNEVRALHIIHSGSDIVNVYIPTLYRHPGKTGSHEIKIMQIVSIPGYFTHSDFSYRSSKNFFSFSGDGYQGGYRLQEAAGGLKKKDNG